MPASEHPERHPAEPPETREAPYDPVAVLTQTIKTSGRALWCVAAAVLGRRDDADDVVQEAYVVALNKKDEIQGVRDLQAWLAQIVRFVALNRRRARKPGTHIDGEPLGTVPARAENHPGRVVDTHGRLLSADGNFDDRTLRALQTLDDTARSCLLLRVLLDMSYKEIGAVLEIPEGTAMSHVFRSRKVMLERLSPDTPARGSEVVE